MYAAHQGWLDARPSKANKTRREHYGSSDPVCDSPDVDDRLIFSFHDIGMCKSNGMGISAVDWVDVSAYSSSSMCPLDRWESTQIIRMSRIYTRFRNDDSEDTVNPYRREFTDEDWLRRSNTIIDSLRNSKDDFDEQMREIKTAR